MPTKKELKKLKQDQLLLKEKERRENLRRTTDKKIEKLNQDLKEEKLKSKNLSTQLINLSEYIKTKRKSINLKISEIKASSPGDYFIRIAMPDTHGQHHDPKAISAFLNDLKKLAFNKDSHFIILGDFIDCGGWLAKHHVLGYSSQINEGSYSSDIEAGNLILNEIDGIVGDVHKHFIEGNHEHRMERWLVDQMMRDRKDVEYFMATVAPNVALKLAERGYTYYQRGGFYNNLTLNGSIKIGKCHFTHGSAAPKHAAAHYASMFGGNVVYGHTHRMDSWHTRNVSQGNYGAWNPGCLCVMQPLYMDTNITGWTHGYGLQIVNKQEKFLHINVPIINGESFLFPLIEGLVK